MKALRVFNPDAKKHHWGKRKPKREDWGPWIARSLCTTRWWWRVLNEEPANA